MNVIGTFSGVIVVFHLSAEDNLFLQSSSINVLFPTFVNVFGVHFPRTKHGIHIAGSPCMYCSGHDGIVEPSPRRSANYTER